MLTSGTEANVTSKVVKGNVINKDKKYLYHGLYGEQRSLVDSTGESPNFIYKMFPLLKGCLEIQFHSTPTSE